MTTAKTGCLSSPLVMNPRLGAKERSKSTGWSSSTVICVRGAGQGCFFRYKTGSISVTGSLAAARTRVYDTNPPLVGLVGLVFSDYRRYAWFSCRSTQDRKRSRPHKYKTSVLKSDWNFRLFVRPMPIICRGALSGGTSQEPAKPAPFFDIYHPSHLGSLKSPETRRYL